MKKIIFSLVLILGSLQFTQGQPAFVQLCQGDSYTWYFDTSPTSQVIIRAMGNGTISYDTINDNKIVLTPQYYTIYDIMSINNIPYTCNESMIVEVIDIFPTTSIINDDLSLILSANLNGEQVYVHVTNDTNALIYRCNSMTGDTINIENIPAGNYQIYVTSKYSNCQTMIPITIP